MPRSGEDARHRLQEAALRLFTERGYNDTTAAAIAEQAGVTERTFFRHFADKRDVLFDGEREYLEALTGAVAAAPGDDGPLDVVRRAFSAVVPLLAGKRSFSKPRRAVIEANPVLLERQLAKEAGWQRVLAEGLIGRGVPARAAALAAQVGMAAFGDAMAVWAAVPDESLDDLLDHSFAEVRALTG